MGAGGSANASAAADADDAALRAFIVEDVERAKQLLQRAEESPGWYEGVPGYVWCLLFVALFWEGVLLIFVSDRRIKVEQNMRAGQEKT